MKNSMMTVAEAAARIEAGAVLMIAGSEAALSQLPPGRWIGGTAVYFMTEEGGRTDRSRVHVTEVAAATDARSDVIAPRDLPDLARGRFDHGLTLILIPAFSQAHTDFAIHGATYPGLFDQPLMGWIAGVHLDDIGTVTPKVFDGATATAHDEGALVLHVALDADAVPSLDIVNLFTPDRAAPAVVFDETGFRATRARVGGAEVGLAAWVRETGIDTRLPLVADYAGALINVSFQSVDEGGVSFYAPVVAGVEYRLAADPGAYAEVFASRATGDGARELACNCILNYLYGALEGRRTGSFTGPATFGEIAYILLNQTLVRLSVNQAAARDAA